MASKDGRADNFSFYGPCHWCCGVKCTTDGNRCEVQSFLTAHDYVGKSRNGIGHDTCADKGLALRACMYVCMYVCIVTC